jgi:hypothetical protein
MPGLLRGVARTAVVAGTATAVSNNVSRRQARRWQEQGEVQPGYLEPSQQAAPAAPAADPMTAQLEQLAALKNQGILTQEEFDAKKKQILGI